MASTKVAKSTTLDYTCTHCNYSCCNKSNFNKHCSTRKHTMMTKGLQNDDKNIDISGNVFDCDCGKKFTRRQNLWRHKKKCVFMSTDLDQERLPEPTITSAMFMKVLDDNKGTPKSIMFTTGADKGAAEADGGIDTEGG